MSIPPAAAPPPASTSPPTSGAPPGAPPPANPFGETLAEEWARTAPAEGQKSESPKSGRDQQGEGRRAEASAGSAQETAGQVAEAEAATAANQTAVPAGKPTGHQAPVRGDGAPVGASGSGPDAEPPASAPGSSTAPAPPDEGKGAAETLTERALPAAPSTASASLEAAAAAKAVEVAKAGPGAPPQAASAAAQDAARAHQQAIAAQDATDSASTTIEPAGVVTSRQTLQERISLRQGATPTGSGTPTPAPSASTLLPGTPAVHAEAVPNVAAAGLAAVPGAGAATVARGAATATGVDMNAMIESIHTRIELAARQGESQARISLEPAELGEIKIHLTQTSEGLLARLTAGTAAGAQALAAGRNELHQALSSLGTTLLRLDIGSSGLSEGRQGRPEDGPAASARRFGSTDGEETIETTTGPQGSQPAGPQALGEIVDVLA